MDSTTSQTNTGAAPLPAPEPPRRRIVSGEGSLRQSAARGTLVNGAFNIGLQAIGLVRGFIVAAVIAPGDYGVWGIITVVYATVLRLKTVGVSDKYVQQDDPDEEVAFQKAFTLELILTGSFFFLLLALAPVLTVAYGESKLLAPALVTAMALPAVILQTPLWVFYRRMNFLKQRTLQIIDPVSNTAVTIALALSGAGYWSFVAGNIVGLWLGALVIMRAAPYRLRLRYDRGTAREYITFSAPLFIQALGALVVAQGTVLVAKHSVGLAGVGALSLAATITSYTQAADGVVTQTLYPAVCAVKDRTELLFESFVKSNRLALMWGVPFGAGVALFASDLVHFGIGEQWRHAVVVFQAAGIVSAIGHIGFNWDAYFRANGNTKPLAISSMVSLLAYAIGPIPLLITHGLPGYALGLGLVSVVTFVTRWVFLSQLFSGFAMLRHASRAIAPTLPATAVVLLVRAVEPGPRSVAHVVLEAAVYLAATALATWVFERALLREMLRYLRPAAPPASVST